MNSSLTVPRPMLLIAISLQIPLLGSAVDQAFIPRGELGNSAAGAALPTATMAKCSHDVCPGITPASLKSVMAVGLHRSIFAYRLVHALVIWLPTRTVFGIDRRRYCMLTLHHMQVSIQWHVMIGRWFNEGVEVDESGVHANDCPNPMGSAKQGLWLAGWKQALGRATTSQSSGIAEPSEDAE